MALLAVAGLEVRPELGGVIEGVTVSDLDQGHVVPNMGVIVWHGLWYPNLNSS